MKELFVVPAIEIAEFKEDFITLSNNYNNVPPVEGWEDNWIK